MGYHASAMTLIGIRVLEDDLYEEREVRVKKGPKGARFCPDTGEPLFETDREPLPGYEPERHFEAGGNKHHVTSGGTDDEDLFICVWSEEVGRSDEPKMSPLPSIPSGERLEKLKAPLREALGELWDENAFGHWTILHESY